MNIEKNEISKALELVKFVWDNEKIGGNSYTRLNELMRNAVKLAIEAQLKFNKDDVNFIFHHCNGGYWFRANTNGKGCGEDFYSFACKVDNTSFCQSYESFYDFKPFISKKGNRLYERATLRSNDKRFRVTGFDFDIKRIHLVSYDISDWHEKGKRNLHSFDNKEWNEFRKQLEEF